MGRKHEGFIGKVYLKFPFPKKMLFFKQSSNSYKTQEIILPLIKSYSEEIVIKVVVRVVSKVISIGPYRFSFDAFAKMIQYVLEGGYPRWDEEIAPDYVVSMKKIVKNNNVFDVKLL